MLRQTDDSRSIRSAQANHPRQGVIYGILSYGLWGLVPLYFKLVADVSPPEVLAQRVIWSFVLLAAVVTLAGRWRDVRPALRSRSIMLALATSTLLMAFNRFVYIDSVSTNARFRWEYQPGSELFVVFDEQRETPGTRFPVLANRAIVVKITRLFRL